MKAPRIVAATVDWPAVRMALAVVPTLAASDHPLARLNAATGSIFSNIGASTVPVLLPFDTASFLTDKAAGALGDITKYMPGYSPTNVFFDAGPAGYDAALTLQAAPGTPINFRRRVDVLISGSAVSYELDGTPPPQGQPVPELEGLFPGIRRQTLEDHLRYTFVRFGVPYLVTVMCQRSRCRNEEKIGIAFLKSLAIVGGAARLALDPPAPAGEAGEVEETGAPVAIAEPKTVSHDFTYYAPGDILPGTGMRGQSGDTDPTVYGAIRFPMAEAPAFVNSQTFMNWGNCDFTGRVALGGRGKDAQYRCRVNSIPLVRDESRNYAYPWRDNFCEHRYFGVGQCPAGLGHQGEDIRPGNCEMRRAGDGRCEPYFADVVAVRDGMVMRSPGDEALYLVVNAPGEHIRFRYLHMNPRLLDAAGMVNGRVLKEGELIGTVDDYEGHQGGTSYHLHFDMQVPTRVGWVYVNPYMTLVASYEQLIAARGKVVNDAVLGIANPQSPGTPSAPNVVSPPAMNPPVADANTQNPVPPAMPGAPDVIAMPATNPPAADAGATTIVSEPPVAERCVTRLVKGHRRRRCQPQIGQPQIGQPKVGEQTGGGPRATPAARPAARRASRQSPRVQHPHNDIHTRHAHRSSGNGRA